MRLQPRAWEIAEPLQKSPDFIAAHQSLAGVIKASISFLERIVTGQNGSNSGNDLRRRRGDQECSQRTMIETNSVGHGETLAATSPVRRRYQGGFFHADVPQQRTPKLLVRVGATGEQSFDPTVILGQQLMNGAWQGLLP